MGKDLEEYFGGMDGKGRLGIGLSDVHCSKLVRGVSRQTKGRRGEMKAMTNF